MAKFSSILKVISFLILAATWVFTIVKMSALPDLIPVHYDLAGTPDRFGAKHSLLFLNGIMTVIFLLLRYLSKNPTAPGLNIPQNLKDNPATSEFVVSVLMLMIMLLYGNITYESVLNGLGKTEGLTPATHYILGLLFLFMLGMMLYSWRSTKTKNRSSEL